MPFPDRSFDVVFCFQAAHHFILYEESLREIYRLLKPGGCCLYLHEPSCASYIHPLAKWRVNRKRPECPEDVLVVEDMKAIGSRIGFKVSVVYSATTLNRGVVEGLYYKVLSMAPVLCKLLPCTADYIFSKPL